LERKDVDCTVRALYPLLFIFYGEGDDRKMLSSTHRKKGEEERSKLETKMYKYIILKYII
jgi:hypothetical protein